MERAERPGSLYSFSTRPGLARDRSDVNLDSLYPGTYSYSPSNSTAVSPPLDSIGLVLRDAWRDGKAKAPTSIFSSQARARPSQPTEATRRNSLSGSVSNGSFQSSVAIAPNPIRYASDDSAVITIRREHPLSPSSSIPMKPKRKIRGSAESIDMDRLNPVFEASASESVGSSTAISALVWNRDTQQRRRDATAYDIAESALDSSEMELPVKAKKSRQANRIYMGRTQDALGSSSGSEIPLRRQNDSRIHIDKQKNVKSPTESTRYSRYGAQVEVSHDDGASTTVSEYTAPQFLHRDTMVHPRVAQPEFSSSESSLPFAKEYNKYGMDASMVVPERALGSTSDSEEGSRYIGTRRLPPVAALPSSSFASARHVPAYGAGAIEFSNLENEGDIDFDCGSQILPAGKGASHLARGPSTHLRRIDDEESWLASSESDNASPSPSASVSMTRSSVASASETAYSTTQSKYQSREGTVETYTTSNPIGLGQSEEHWRRHGLYDGKQRRRYSETDFSDLITNQQSQSHSVDQTQTNCSSSSSREDTVPLQSSTGSVAADSSVASQGPIASPSSSTALDSRTYADESFTDLQSGTMSHHHAIEATSVSESVILDLPPVAELWSGHESVEDSVNILGHNKAAPQVIHDAFEMKALAWAIRSVKTFNQGFVLFASLLTITVVGLCIGFPELPIIASVAVVIALGGMTYRELRDLHFKLSGLMPMYTSLAGISDQYTMQQPTGHASDGIDLEKLVREGVQNNLVRLKLILVTYSAATGSFGTLLCITWSMTKASLSTAGLYLGLTLILLGATGALVAVYQYRGYSAQLRAKLNQRGAENV